MSDADNCPPGSDVQSETLTRFREYRRTHDRTLRNKLIEEHLSLARTLARRFANRNEPLDDLEQVAMLGVLKAVERFDPDRGTPFAAFAVPTALGELRRHFRDHGWMVKVPRRIQNLHLHMGALVTDLSQRLDGTPADARIWVAQQAHQAGDRLRRRRANTTQRLCGNAADRVLGVVQQGKEESDRPCLPQTYYCAKLSFVRV